MIRSNSLTLAFCLCLISLQAQTSFTRITDTNNPIYAKIGAQGYIGASWVDYNNDGWQDLYVTRSFLFKNLGNGQFEALEPIKKTAVAQGFANTWADYDNDGDLDVFITGAKNSKGSALYRNEGNDIFIKDKTGIMNDTLGNAGWGAAWGDYDNDGKVDLVVAAAFGFGGVTHNNRLFHNEGNGTFSRVDSSIISAQSAPYTVPSWADYDLDGDLDLFIGSGPATGTLAPDFLFLNHLKENKKAFFTRLLTDPIGTDKLDGQVWNWVDYDNDGDLDGFVTNYNFPTPNNLYRNDNGTFKRITEAEVGTIVSDKGLFLANTWGDFDNDGDLDCLTSRDSGNGTAPGECLYYQNNGDGTFSPSLTSFFKQMTNFASCVSYADYDRDGDLDIFATGTGKAFGGLFKNNLSNGNSWVNFHCIGKGDGFSNKAGIGTKIRITTTINGKKTTLIREVATQNSFNGHNMLNIHFGLGDAKVIDNVEIMWSSGEITNCKDVIVNKFYDIKEGDCPKLATVASQDEVSEKKSKILVFPNPTQDLVNVQLEVPQSGNYQVSIVDNLGRKVFGFNQNLLQDERNVATFDIKKLPSGVYVVIVEKETWRVSEAFVKK